MDYRFFYEPDLPRLIIHQTLVRILRILFNNLFDCKCCARWTKFDKTFQKPLNRAVSD